MEKPKKPRYAVQVRCESEIEQRAFHMVAASRGLTFSDMVRLDYLQQKPKVTFATVDQEKILKMLAVVGNIVSLLDEKMKKLNPRRLEVMQIMPDLTEEQRVEYYKLDSARQGALLCFLHFQSDLHGRNKG